MRSDGQFHSPETTQVVHMVTGVTNHDHMVDEETQQRDERHRRNNISEPRNIL